VSEEPTYTLTRSQLRQISKCGDARLQTWLDYLGIQPTPDPVAQAADTSTHTCSLSVPDATAPYGYRDCGAPAVVGVDCGTAGWWWRCREHSVVVGAETEAFPGRAWLTSRIMHHWPVAGRVYASDASIRCGCSATFWGFNPIGQWLDHVLAAPAPPAEEVERG